MLVHLSMIVMTRWLEFMEPLKEFVGSLVLLTPLN